MLVCVPSAAVPLRRAAGKPRGAVGGVVSTPKSASCLVPSWRPAAADPARLLRARAAPPGGAGAGSDSDGARELPKQPQQHQQGAELDSDAVDGASADANASASANANAAAAAAAEDLGIEAVVDAVKAVGHGTFVVLLRLLDGTSRLLPIFIGEFEAAALSRALAAGPSGGGAAGQAHASGRPQTYDLLGSAVRALGRAVAHVRVTDLKHNTYHACVSLVPAAEKDDGGAPPPSAPAVELDARPSDALNLALRCGCAVYVGRPVAELCAQPEALLPPELLLHASPSSPSSPLGRPRAAGAAASSSSSASASLHQAPHHHHHHHHHHHQSASAGESHAEIVRTSRAALASYRDPTPMLALARDVAAAQERYEDASAAQAALARCVTRDGALRLAAAVEAALADGRYGEAARLRDELLRAVAEAEAAHSSQEEEEEAAASVAAEGR
jgi:bifunctional DNase/RNase